MSPPPVTPSPHRFIVKKQAPPRKTPLVQQQTPQRPSTQRVNATPRASRFNVAAPRPSQLNATHHPRSSAPQFNATPRFNFSSTPRPTASQNPPASTPASARFVTPARPIANLEDVVDYSPDDPSQEIYESIETATQGEDLEYDSADNDGFEIHARSPKRRRLTSSPLPTEVVNNEEYNDGFETSPLPILSSPQASRRQITTTAPRFLISTPLPPSTPQQDSAQPTFLKPPRFRPPDPSAQSQATDPLPEQFSPHRRGQKYLPGGLAAEVRDWLMNIESTVSAAGGQKKRVDEWTVKLVVDEVSGGTRAGMTLVRGRQLHAGDDETWIVDRLGVVRVALAGEGAGTGLQKGKKAELGKIVGIKGPLWEIMVEGEKWGIGVDWKVLDDL